jgi:hypothetical protein
VTSEPERGKLATKHAGRPPCVVVRF